MSSRLCSLLPRARSRVKEYFVQTFRRHTPAEYSEFLTRGIKGEDGVRRIYPWMYVRVFAAAVIVFAVYLLIVRFTGNELFLPVTVVLGGVVFNIPFLILLYEMYPRGDLSLLGVFLVFLIGGTAACVICQIVFSLVAVGGGWAQAAFVGSVEEFAKAVAAVACIAAVRNRQPLVGFVLGAAVGCGFSVVEDAGYIFREADALSEFDISAAVGLFFSRGGTAFCTHTVWTAAVGWAFASARRPLLSVRLYACFISAICAHVLWNSPLSGGAKIAVIVILILAALAFACVVLAVFRGRLLKGAGLLCDPSREGGSPVRDRLYYKHAGHLSLAIGAFVMAVISIGCCLDPSLGRYRTYTFSSPQSFVEFMQEGYDLVAPYEREYDPSAGDYSVTTVDGVITAVTQRVMFEEGGEWYYFNYSVLSIGDGVRYMLSACSVELEVGGLTRRYFAEDAYNTDGTLYASYFRVRSDVSGVLAERKGGSISVIVYDPDARPDIMYPSVATLTGCLAAASAASLVLFSYYYVRARRAGGGTCDTK